MGRVREKRRAQERKSEKRRKKIRVFPMICGSGRSTNMLTKAAGAEPAGQMRDEQLHTVVARSTFPSQNVKNTTGSDHFWKLRCRKSARRCGAKHISKSKVEKSGCTENFWTFRCASARQAEKKWCTWSKLSKT